MRRIFGNLHEAWWFLVNHPVRGHLDTSFVDALDVSVMKVDPVTGCIEGDPARNTAIRVWLESGPGYTKPEGDFASVPWHDTELDCAGDTFEAAVLSLAGLVAAKYGDYASNRPRGAHRQGAPKRRSSSTRLDATAGPDHVVFLRLTGSQDH